MRYGGTGMMTTRRTEGGPSGGADGPVPVRFEARIPAVFAGVLATWVLIAAWKLVRGMLW